MVSYVDSIPFQTCIRNTSKARRFSDEGPYPAFRAPAVETRVLCGRPLTPVHPERSPTRAIVGLPTAILFVQAFQCFRRVNWNLHHAVDACRAQIARFSNMCSVFVNRT